MSRLGPQPGRDGRAVNGSATMMSAAAAPSPARERVPVNASSAAARCVRVPSRTRAMPGWTSAPGTMRSSDHSRLSCGIGEPSARRSRFGERAKFGASDAADDPPLPRRAGPCPTMGPRPGRCGRGPIGAPEAADARARAPRRRRHLRIRLSLSGKEVADGPDERPLRADPLSVGHPRGHGTGLCWHRSRRPGLATPSHEPWLRTRVKGRRFCPSPRRPPGEGHGLAPVVLIRVRGPAARARALAGPARWMYRFGRKLRAVRGASSRPSVAPSAHSNTGCGDRDAARRPVRLPRPATLSRLLLLSRP